MSQGILQPDMWGVKPSDRWDWEALRRDISQHGVRNSLLVRRNICSAVGKYRIATLVDTFCEPPCMAQVAPMPTASTSQILGNNECFEPYTSNIYVRRVLSGAARGAW